VFGATPSGGKILNFSWVSAAFTFSHYKTTQSERKMQHIHIKIIFSSQRRQRNYTPRFLHLFSATKMMTLDIIN